MNKIVDTPPPPYYAVIAPAEFSAEIEGYAEMAAKMIEIAHDQPGFLGIEACLTTDFLMAVSYWESLEAIKGWRAHTEHLVAKDAGKAKWFARYMTRIALVEDAY